MSDLVNLFTASKGGRTLWERLKTRMGSGRRSRRNDRKVMERVFTPKDAVRLILTWKCRKIGALHVLHAYHGALHVCKECSTVCEMRSSVRLNTYETNATHVCAT